MKSIYRNHIISTLENSVRQITYEMIMGRVSFNFALDQCVNNLGKALLSCKEDNKLPKKQVEQINNVLNYIDSTYSPSPLMRMMN